MKVMTHYSILMALFFICFNVGFTQANEIDKATAMEMLSNEAENKIPASELGSLLEKDVQEFIVVFDETNVSQESLASLSAQEQLQTTADASKEAIRASAGQPSKMEVLHDYSMLPMMAIKTSSREAFVEILGRSDVVSVNENKVHETHLTESLPLISQPQVVQKGHQGENTAIAIIDSRVDYTLPEFGGCTSPNVPAGCRVVHAQDFANKDDPNSGSSAHGTNVAAIAAGVAPGASIIALDVLYKDSTTDSAIYIEAMNWAIGNKKKYNIVAMNLSIGERNGIPYSTECGREKSVVAMAVNKARQVGIITVFSSGNKHYKNGITAPSCVPGAVRVGAVYDQSLSFSSSHGCEDRPATVDNVTCFSNTSKLLTLLAPGAAITAGGENNRKFGTSQAAPHVAGAIAVMRASDVAPNDSLNKTIERLKRTGVPITDTREGSPNPPITKPRLNLEAAVNDAVSVEVPIALEPNGSTTNSHPIFKWKEVPGTIRYAVVAKDSSGNSLVNNSTGTITCPGGICSYTKSDTTFPAGDYTWNVRVINPDNSNGATSDTLSFGVKGAGCQASYPLPKNIWRLISLPCEPPSNANTVAAIFSDDIPGGYGSEWAVYSYLDSVGGYEKESLDSQLKQGKGYWIISTNGSTTLHLPTGSQQTPTSIAANSAACASSTGCFEIPIVTNSANAEWNLLGHPYLSATSINRLRIITDVATSPHNCGDANGCTLDQAKEDGVVHNQFWNYAGNAYSVLTSADKLESWTGFWAASLKNAAGLNTRLLVAKEP